MTDVNRFAIFTLTNGAPFYVLPSAVIAFYPVESADESGPVEHVKIVLPGAFLLVREDLELVSRVLNLEFQR